MNARPPSAIASRALARDLLFEISSTVRRFQRTSTSPLDVHQTRKSLTRMRALLRLLREAIGDQTYHRCNAVVRDAGRQLNAARDAQVLLQTAEGLRSPEDGAEMSRMMDLLCKMLTRQQAALQPRVGAFRENVLALQRAFRDLNELPEATLLSLIAGEGIVRAYKRGRKTFLRAQKQPSDANLHEWRKQMKYLSYETDALLRYVHGRISRLHRRASLLATYLGGDHDLAVLQTQIRLIQGSTGYVNRKDSIHELKQRMKRSRAKLQRSALKLGMKCFRRRSRRFRWKDYRSRARIR